MPPVRFINTILLTGFLFLAGALPVSAAKAPVDGKELEKQATHIVTGKVIAVTSEVRKSTHEKAVGIHRDEIFTLSVKVDAATKGKGIKAGDTITVVAWKPHTRIPPLPGLQGHEPIPGKGAVATFHLTKNGKVFEPLLPNGIGITKAAP